MATPVARNKSQISNTKSQPKGNAKVEMKKRKKKGMERSCLELSSLVVPICLRFDA